MKRVLSGKGQRLAGAVLFACTCIGLVLIAALQKGNVLEEARPSSLSRKQAQRLPGGSVPVVGQIEQSLAKSFAIFRTSPEGLPAAVTKTLRVPTYGMNWHLAQLIPVSTVNSFWAVPGRDVICIVSRQAEGIVSSNCARTAHAITHGITATFLKAGGSSQDANRLIVGIAPDGVAAMKLYSNGKMTTVPVFGGAFTLEDAIRAVPERVVPVEASG